MGCCGQGDKKTLSWENVRVAEETLAAQGVCSVDLAVRYMCQFWEPIYIPILIKCNQSTNYLISTENYKKKQFLGLKADGGVFINQ